MILNFNNRQIFFLFLVFHVFIWTIIPYIGRYSLHHDVLEGIAQGLQYQFGYSKHPFLSMWLVAKIWEYMHPNDIAIYFVSQLLIGISFYYLWRLNKCLLHPWSALLATLIADGMMAFNFDANVLTPDTLQIPCWAAIGFYAHKLLSKPEKLQNWLVLSNLFGLGFLIKYQIIFLMLPLLFLFLCNKSLRFNLKSLNFMIAVFYFLLVISPHLYWMFSHDLSNLYYTKQTLVSHQTVTTINIIVNYLTNSLAICAGVLGLFLITSFKTSKENIKKIKVHQQFVTCLALGPWLLTFLFSLMTHTDILARWMTPYFIFLSTFLCHFFAPKIELKQINILLSIFVLGAIGFTGMALRHLVFNPRCDALYPNKQIANFLETQWSQHSQKPMQYISGSRYLVSSIIPYIHSLPKPFFSIDLASNPWIKIHDVKENGGIFVWDIDGNYAWDIESSLYKKPFTNHYFPHLLNNIQYKTFYTFKKHRPIKIAYVILTHQS